MELDHSQTYRDRSLHNLPHRGRLATVLSILDENADSLRGKTYADVGCSNGYVTAIIAERFEPSSACGFDHQEYQVRDAREAHPGIEFKALELAERQSTLESYDTVTCLEVIEHVGTAGVALDNLLDLTRPGGLLLISAPIEVGLRGLFKFVAKTLFYRARLEELPQRRALGLRYTLVLLTGGRISQFRDDRSVWGTHFGFDYRDIDDMLKARKIPYQAFNRFTTRFYLVRR